MVEIKVYALTTCPHCKKVIELLKRSGVDFETIYIDELEGEEREKIVEEVHKISGSYSIPLIVKGDKFVLGYVEDKIMELLK
ncbi:glutaredoxin family protein [Archaeoglobales archaeon]|nr:MAG: glutaredoxin family protein [Archaeoglobales archaeon]